MPCYRFLCLAKPETHPQTLANIFRTVARVVYQEKGQFRTVENLGVRPLHWAYRDHGTKYREARWVAFTADVSPAGLKQVQNTLRAEENVLMATPLRVRTDADGAVGEFRPHKRVVEKLRHRLPTTPSPLTELLK
jgi:ribosomal protein S6